MSRVLKKTKKEQETKPALFKQDKSEFNKIYNEVKRIAREHSKGVAKIQLDNDFRKRLGLKPKTIKQPYNILLRTKAKEKKERELNAKKVREEELVIAPGFLPQKKEKKKREQTLKLTQGEFDGGILKFDINKDNALNFDEWGKYGKDKKKGNKTFGNSSFKKKGNKKHKKR
ncbi:hypothetical protein ENUP19_0082G0086 [Entamoeba nuttalli]|uniref:EF-hand domain-containing protein n=2 Tax=Entamoeba nuttalli TaxID=412467 RepID=K2H648_ENTNP|nr:hypothetical protein ENU1_039470 [Entamoeba nuttalli P19]EKE41932.1 hypothetical protein ENU1_039470 [Entamoeba nuttalli P19]|eukprot:XP_008855733.1 hypothetical protein ENU1_039470 [Entamoeba nuttalli P19]